MAKIFKQIEGKVYHKIETIDAGLGIQEFTSFGFDGLKEEIAKEYNNYDAVLFIIRKDIEEKKAKSLRQYLEKMSLSGVQS